MKKLIFLLVFFAVFSNSFSQNELKVTTASVNLRTSPEIKDNVICIIPKGTLLQIDNNNQEYSNWIKVTYNYKTGYLYYKYVQSPSNNINVNNSEVKHYTNSKGEKVQSPTYYKSPPAGATAECKDGTYSFSKSRRGTCSHHGGVKRWL